MVVVPCEYLGKIGDDVPALLFFGLCKRPPCRVDRLANVDDALPVLLEIIHLLGRKHRRYLGAHLLMEKGGEGLDGKGGGQGMISERTCSQMRAPLERTAS